MRIPWIPQEQGGGSHGPTLAERIFVGANGQADYGTAMNPVGRKAFMNLPMPTKDAMNIYEPNLHNGPKKGARGMIGSGLRHNHPQGAGENYVDSFVTHPIAGNYEKLFAVLDEQKKEEEVERVPSLTLEMVAQQGYTNMGLNADEERMNSLRDRLRFMGASDEEIETQLKEARQERVRAMAGRAMIPEAHQLFEADKWARQMGVHPGQGAYNFGSVVFHDGNVFNFGTPAPANYAGHKTREGPDNSQFAPQTGHGVHSIEVLPTTEEIIARGRRSKGPQVAGAPDRTQEQQEALVRHGPEIIGRNVEQIRGRRRFMASMRPIYEHNLEKLFARLTAARSALAAEPTMKYHAKKYQLKKIETTDKELRELEEKMSKIQAGEVLTLEKIKSRGRPKRQ